MPMNRRRAFGLLLAALTLLVVMASRAHGHDSVSDFCLLCHVAHLPALNTSSGAQLVLPDFLCWYHLPVETAFPAEIALVCHCSRAPPAAFSCSLPGLAA
jgi:hypothetical protein